MKIQPKKVESIIRTFWNEIKIYFEKSDISKVNFLDLVKEIFLENNVNENGIFEFSFNDILVFNHETKKNETCVQFLIRYLTIDLEDLHSKSEEEQIHFVLDELEYTDYTIQQKKSIDSDSLYWQIYIHDDDFDFDPDESFSEKDFYNFLYEIFNIVLNFRVCIN